MKTVKSIDVVMIKKNHEIRWCSRVRFDDGSQLFAGTDNIHGKSVAEVAHKNTFSAGVVVGSNNDLPFSHDPITRKRIDHWGPLPEDWQVSHECGSATNADIEAAKLIAERGVAAIAGKR
jgi:hypothetical protein